MARHSPAEPIYRQRVKREDKSEKGIDTRKIEISGTVTWQPKCRCRLDSSRYRKRMHQLAQVLDSAFRLERESDVPGLLLLPWWM